MIVLLVLPYPRGGGVNHQYARTARGVRLTDAAKTWREETMLLTRTSGQVLPDGDLDVSITIWQPDMRKTDVDAFVKGILDSVLGGGFAADDNRVCRLTVERFRQARGPDGVRSGVEVRIREWEHAELEKEMR